MGFLDLPIGERQLNKPSSGDLMDYRVLPCCVIGLKLTRFVDPNGREEHCATGLGLNSLCIFLAALRVATLGDCACFMSFSALDESTAELR